MRRLVAALVVALLALSLAGCGGGEEGAPAEATATVAPAAAPPSAPAEIPDRSAPESATVFELFPVGDFVPPTLAEQVAAGQPTLILFVDGSQKVTNEVRSAVDEAINANSGIVELVLFDVGRYVSVDTSGQAIVDVDGIKKDEIASKAVTLARTLAVSGLPYILMTDDQGYVVFRHRGLVDAEYLKMHMERLTDSAAGHGLTVR